MEFLSHIHQHSPLNIYYQKHTFIHQKKNLVSTRQIEVLDCGRINQMQEVRGHVRREKPYPECLPQPEVSKPTLCP